MTDNEIMTFEKAMFILRHGSAEGEHKYFEAIDVIEKEVNHQKAEIERLTNHIQEGIDLVKQIPEMVALAQAEAIKEFWNSRPERLNEQCEGREEYNKGWNACLDEFWEIRNNLVKEMVGEDNGV